jgi:hypothetical protein
MDHCVAEGFLRPQHRQLLMESADMATLLETLLRYRPPEQTPKWADADER